MGLTSSKTIIPIKEADVKLGPVLRMKLDKVRVQRCCVLSGCSLFAGGARACCAEVTDFGLLHPYLHSGHPASCERERERKG